MVKTKSDAAMKNAKVLFIFLLILFLFSGCANKMADNYNLANNVVQNPPPTTAGSQAKREVKILFVGDVMFDRYIREVAEKHGADYNYPLSPIKDFLKQFDLVVANLEGPITDNESKSVSTKIDEKSNLVFTFDPKSAKALAENNIGLVSLGNNHILNQGESGLEETKKYLDEAGVGHFGDVSDKEDGLTIGSPSSSLVIGGSKISFVNYNYSAKGSAERAIDEIQQVKKQSDIVILCPHWGTEFKVGDPGENIRALAHQFIDAGANVIIGTHPHVIESEEEYNNKKIYYSLGNFVFDQYFQKETMEGMGVILTVEPDLAIKYDTVKFQMEKNGQTKLMEN